MIIGDSIKKNHKLYGLHIEGNSGVYLDSQGFIIPFQDNQRGVNRQNKVYG